MNLSQRSLLVRWAYWFEPRESQRREGTTLCAFCWRVFFFAPLLAIFPIFVIGFVLYSAYQHPNEALEALVILGICGTVLWLTFNGNTVFKDVLIVRWMRAVKQKVCPIISFKP